MSVEDILSDYEDLNHEDVLDVLSTVWVSVNRVASNRVSVGRANRSCYHRTTALICACRRGSSR
jgi:hypothetical protein